MTCDECQNRLQEYVDEEVEPSEKAAMDSHISTCEDCSKLHRKIAQFTTTMVKAVQPIHPVSDFSSRVMARLEESQKEWAHRPEQTSAESVNRTYPSWPIALGIGLALLIGLYLLFSSDRLLLGEIVSGNGEHIQVLAPRGSQYEEATGSQIYSGDIIQSDQVRGRKIRISCPKLSGLDVHLLSPFRVQFRKEGSILIVALHQETTGKLFIQAKTGGDGWNGMNKVQIKFQAKYVEFKLGTKVAVDVSPSKLGALQVSVRSGSVEVGNPNERARIAEGFGRLVPQYGAFSEEKGAQKVSSNTFDWVLDQ